MPSKIAVVSCAYATHRREQPAWQQILDQVPDLDLLLMLGDNAYMNWYGDWEIAKLQECYEIQFGIPSFRQLIARVPTLAIWDDHDCGVNDMRGAERPDDVKASRALFDRYMGFAVNAGRKEMYAAYDELPDLRILMLDGRSERTAPGAVASTMLGQAQEDWLWKQLDPKHNPQRPITIVANGTGLSKGSKVEVVDAYQPFAKKLRQALAFRDQPSGEPGDCGRRSLFLAGDIHCNLFKHHPAERLYEVLSSGVACFAPGTDNDHEFTPDRQTDNWTLLTIDDEFVHIDAHGRPDEPGLWYRNNYSRRIRRSDWRLAA